MSEQTVVAESSAATPAMEVERGPLVNMTGEQRAEWRKTGEMPQSVEPESPKSEESAPSDASKETISEAETPKPEAETEAAKKPQEHKKGRAEQRINELISETKRLKQEVETLKSRPTAEPQKSPQPSSQPQTYQDWRKTFKPSVWIEAYAKQNPDASYEDANASMADYLGDVRDQFKSLDQQRQTQTQQISAKVEDAKARYGDTFDGVVMPTVKRIMGVDEITKQPTVSSSVKQMFNESEVLPDLMFTLGSDPADFENFLKMAPGKQLRYIALTESLIHDELEAKAKPPTANPGPVKTQTSAPKPPAEVGGRAATPSDAAESAAKAGDFRMFKQERTRRDLARLKG